MCCEDCTHIGVSDYDGACISCGEQILIERSYYGYRCADGSLEFKLATAQPEADATIIFNCDAASWHQAMDQWHEFNGWKPYVPLKDKSE